MIAARTFPLQRACTCFPRGIKTKARFFFPKMQLQHYILVRLQGQISLFASFELVSRSGNRTKQEQCLVLQSEVCSSFKSNKQLLSSEIAQTIALRSCNLSHVCSVGLNSEWIVGKPQKSGNLQFRCRCVCFANRLESRASCQRSTSLFVPSI